MKNCLQALALILLTVTSVRADWDESKIISCVDAQKDSEVANEEFLEAISKVPEAGKPMKFAKNTCTDAIKTGDVVLRVRPCSVMLSQLTASLEGSECVGIRRDNHNGTWSYNFLCQDSSGYSEYNFNLSGSGLSNCNSTWTSTR